MEVCRLCANKPDDSELVISLDQTIRDQITFNEVVEYHFQKKLNSDRRLPRNVCQTCVKFIQEMNNFITNVQKNQTQLEIYYGVDPIDVKPDEKKIKLKEEEIDTNIKLDVTEELLPEESAKPKKSFKQRRKSVYLELRILKDVKGLFGSLMPSDLSAYDHIGIGKSKILMDGEVPTNWLKAFVEYKTWKDLSFQTNCSCGHDPTDLLETLTHECKLSRTNRVISCGLCDKVCHSTAFQSSIMNHMALAHFDLLRFCCLACSKVFYNMPYLLLHYEDAHDIANLVIYPCLQCGHYSFTFHQLREHKKRVHDKDANNNPPLN